MITLSPRITAFLGPNGAGKTNLLEAVQLVARGTSARSDDDAELIRWGAPFARVTATVERAEDLRRVEVLLFAPAPAERRRPRRWLVDGAGKRPEDAAGLLTVVAFFPNDVDLLGDAPSTRRRYLDGMLSQVDRAHRADVREHARVIEQRNALLRALRDGEGTVSELAFWDAELCRLSAAISLRRIRLVRELSPAFAHATRRFAGPDATLAYIAQVEGETLEDRADAYRRLIVEKRDREMWQGVTLVGPHREDLLVSADGRPLASFASRGEQRGSVLALKLAEAEWVRDRIGEPPVFLLDDVLSELDPERRQALVDALPRDAQVLLTAALPAGLPAALQPDIVAVPLSA